MNHEESKLQQQCVAWFRAQYPHYAMLLTHPANEGNGNRVSGAIHKAEGTVAGVPDLILFMSAEYRREVGSGAQYMALVYHYHAFGIEFKTQKGRQSQQQKDFQQMFDTAGYKYVIVRSFDEFKNVVEDYMGHVEYNILEALSLTHRLIITAAEAKEKEKFQKFINKK